MSTAERTMESYVPKRGDIIWLQFSPQSGHEEAGRRPAIVLSPHAYNALTSLALVCPITSQKKRYPFEVELPSGLAISGVVLSDHVKSIDWKTRGATFVCTAPDTLIMRVLEKIARLLE
jgi:mRNA interferase MazF